MAIYFINYWLRSQSVRPAGSFLVSFCDFVMSKIVPNRVLIASITRSRDLTRSALEIMGKGSLSVELRAFDSESRNSVPVLWKFKYKMQKETCILNLKSDV